VARSTGLICHQTIALNNFYAAKDYPAHLCRIRYRDPVTDKKPLLDASAAEAHQVARLTGHDA
jgi:hypothetical protein